MWVIGVDIGGGGGGDVGGGIGDVGGVVGRTAPAASSRDAVQPRLGHTARPQTGYLSVPDMRRKCYKIPPENELCLCEDIFQQHQAKLVDCDVEDAIAVETYKEFDSNEDMCDGKGDECCCGDEDSSSEPSDGDGPAKQASGDGGQLVPLLRSPTVDRLTAEERDQVLRELDDVVTGNFLMKVRRFSRDVRSPSLSSGGEPREDLGRVVGRLCKRSSSLNTEEMVNFGRVAELTRRFSRLGEPSAQYRSEPDFLRHGFLRASDYDDGGTTSSDSDYELIQHPVRMVFIQPMSVSDDRLHKGGVVLTEVTGSDAEDADRLSANAAAAAQKRRLSFARKSVAFDGSLSSVDDGGPEPIAARYARLKGGGGGDWTAADNVERTINYSKSSDAVSVSNLSRTHRRYSSVDVYEQVKNAAAFLDVRKTEQEFRDGLVAKKSRRNEAIQEYLANKELLLIKMKSASVGGVLRWNQEHQDTLLDDEEPKTQQQQLPSLIDSDDEDEGSPPKDGLRRVLRNGLKGRRIRRLRKLESRSGGLTLADLWRVSRDEPSLQLPPSQRHGTGCSSAETPDRNHNTP